MKININNRGTNTCNTMNIINEIQQIINNQMNYNCSNNNNNEHLQPQQRPIDNTTKQTSKLEYTNRIKDDKNKIINYEKRNNIPIIIIHENNLIMNGIESIDNNISTTQINKKYNKMKSVQEKKIQDKSIMNIYNENIDTSKIKNETLKLKNNNTTIRMETRSIKRNRLNQITEIKEQITNNEVHSIINNNDNKYSTTIISMESNVNNLMTSKVINENDNIRQEKDQNEQHNMNDNKTIRQNNLSSQYNIPSITHNKQIMNLKQKKQLRNNKRRIT